MTKHQAISEHAKLVQSRNTLRAQGNLDPQFAVSVERKISVLGQVHNPRISAKSIAALQLS